MSHPLHRAKRLSMPLALALAVVVACTDRPGPVAPDPGGAGEPAPPGSPPPEFARLDCVADVRGRALTCDPPDAVPGDSNALIIYGGQNRYVELASSQVDYDSTTHKFTMNVRVRNLIRQAIGTEDGTTADPRGVMVFFVTPPTGTGGTVGLDNVDGYDLFTASDQAYYRYVTVLQQFQQSAARTWQFDVPPAMERFTFSVLVAAPVQYPTGWVEVSHPTWSMRRTFSRLVTATVYNQYGNEIPGAAVTWSSSNPALASVAADSGHVSGLLPGMVEIVATTTNDVPGTAAAVQTGKAVFTILGVSQTWTAGAGNTDWNDPANWSRGVSPVAQDSVTIPVVGAGLYPQLVENEQIGRIDMSDGASINLGPFNLTASQDVIAAPFSGGITGSVGRLSLTGTAKNVAGILPRTTVTGTYSLTGNVTSIASLRIERGRIRNGSFRIRTTSQ